MTATTKNRFAEPKQKLQEEEAADSASRHKGKKHLQRFDALVSPWIHGWDDGLTSLTAAKLMLSPGEQKQFEELLKSYKKSAAELNMFIRSRRIDMQKKA